jgi:hypothetical protein
MNFSINEEQAMLADSVARFIDNDYSFEQRMKIAEDEAAFSRDMWKSYAELGWTAVLFDEQDGGLGGGPVELMLMMEQFGRGLVVEPFLANIILAGGVLKRAASPRQKEEWLTGIIEGRVQAALAFAEPQARFDIANIACSARNEGDEWLLRGDKTMVLNGGDANLLSRPRHASTRMRRVTPRGTRWPRSAASARSSANERPSSSSMAMKGSVSSTPSSRMLTTLGWCTWAVMRASLRNICTMRRSDTRWGSSRFTATAGPRWPSSSMRRPRYTSAMPPVAMRALRR